MKKYSLGIIAIASAVSLSSFTSHVFKAKKFTANWYIYTGDQSIGSREDALSYALDNSPGCSGSSNECAVELNQSGMTPDFSNITFDSNGFPNGSKSGHSDFVANAERTLP